MNANPFSLLKPQHKTPSFSQKGLTLIESLTAIVITGVILSLIAPPLLLSAATRIQSRKAEQAQGIVRQEIDRIRAALSREDGIPVENEDGFVPPETTADPLNSAPSPNDLVNQRSNLDAPRKALRVDVDGDGEDDFFVQLLRNPGARFGSGIATCQLAVFEMGVRVYDIAAAENLTNNTLGIAPISVQMTSGLNQRETNPLAVGYTEVSRSDLKISLLEYREYLNEQQTIPPNCQTLVNQN